MKPLITITGFEQGMVPDITAQIGNGFNFGAGIDIYEIPGKMKVAKELVAMEEAASTNDVTDLITWMVKFSVDGKVYGIGSGGSNRIYDYDSTVAGKWSLVHDDANGGFGGGMIEFDKRLFWASTSKLGEYDPTNWTDSFKTFTAADNLHHPMVIYQNKLCVGDGRYIATLTEGDSWDPTALTLPEGYRVRSLAVFGNRLLIGTWRGTNIYDQPEARVFQWELDQPAYEHAFTLKEAGIHAMAVWKNNLIIFAGTTGNIYAYNGASVRKIAEVPKVVGTSGEFIEVLPGSVSEFDGNLIFGISNGTVGSGGSYRGIFSLGQKTSESPLSLVSPLLLSGGITGDLRVGAIFQAGTQVLYIAWLDNDATTYGVDQIRASSRTPTGAFWESQEYNISIDNEKTLLKAIEIIADPIDATSSIIIKYKLDSAATWSTLGTIKATNQDKFFLGLGGLAKTIQIRLELVTTSSNNDTTPVLSTIKIY